MKRSLLIGIAVLSIAVIAFFILQDRTSTSNLPDHGLLFPELVDQINDVTQQYQYEQINLNCP